MKHVLVNGFAIRQSFDTDFGLFHEHSEDITAYDSKLWIPKGEIWIDHLFSSEFNFVYAEHQKLSRLKGQSYYDYRHSIVKNLSLHNSRDFALKVLPYPQNPDLKICYVDGSKLRHHDPEFIQGGHHYVYPYIPENEIWLDALHDPRDHSHILVHEVVERNLMKNHGFSYDDGHDFAIAEEKKSRRAAGGSYPGDTNFPHLSLSEFLESLKQM